MQDKRVVSPALLQALLVKQQRDAKRAILQAAKRKQREQAQLRHGRSKRKRTEARLRAAGRG